MRWLKQVVFGLVMGVLFSNGGHSEDLKFFRNSPLFTKELEKSIRENNDPGYGDMTALYTVNSTGNSSSDYCSIDPLHIIHVHDNFLPKSHPVVVDIGSGYGGCSKQFAFLGYKVFPVDINLNHLGKGITHLCIPPRAGSLLDILLLKHNIVNNFGKSFIKVCQKIYSNYYKPILVSQNLTELEKTQSENARYLSAQKQWNIILAFNVLQWIQPPALKSMLDMIKTKLAHDGLNFYSTEAPVRLVGLIEGNNRTCQ